MRFEREALLRPEFANLYPYLTAGVWDSAAVFTDRIVAHMLSRPEGRIIRGQRVLDPEHFEFRGGESRPRASQGQERRRDNGPKD